MGADGEGQTGGYSGTRVQRAAVVREGIGDEGVECPAEWMAAGDRGVRGQPGQWGQWSRSAAEGAARGKRSR